MTKNPNIQFKTERSLPADLKYNVIYADCPWNIKAGRPLKGYKRENGKQLFITTSQKSKDLPYPTMTIDEMENLDVKSITADNAHLYFWTTNQYLPKAFQMAKKPLGGGLGGTFKITTEFLIFATKGSLKANEMVIGTWFDVKRKYVNGYPCHSKKPDFFYELIEKVSPGLKLEMFARENRNGWDAFGNEIHNSISIPLVKIII
jgi:N6-adenosine-specific RNA methylase IME4